MALLYALQDRQTPWFFEVQLLRLERYVRSCGIDGDLEFVSSSPDATPHPVGG